jgi:hypothetical protein
VVEELAQSNGHGVAGNGSVADPDAAEFAVVEARESVSARAAASGTSAAVTDAGSVTAPTPVVAAPAPPTSAPTDDDEDEDDLDLDEPRRRRAGRAERRAQAPVRRGRRVRRVIRRIDLWSVLKLAIVLYTCLYGAVLATVALLWGVLYSSGQIDKLESFLADVGLENYRFYGDQMFRAVMAIGAVGVLAATLLTVITAALVNLVSEITGGIRVIVIEEDPVRPEARAPRR